MWYKQKLVKKWQNYKYNSELWKVTIIKKITMITYKRSNKISDQVWRTLINQNQKKIITFSLSLFLLSFSLFLSHTHSLTLALYLSLSHSLCLSVSLVLSVSLYLTNILSISLSISNFEYLTLPLYLFHSLPLSLPSLSLSLSLSLSVYLSIYPSIYLSLPKVKLIESELIIVILQKLRSGSLDF